MEVGDEAVIQRVAATLSSCWYFGCFARTLAAIQPMLETRAYSFSEDLKNIVPSALIDGVLTAPKFQISILTILSVHSTHEGTVIDPARKQFHQHRGWISHFIESAKIPFLSSIRMQREILFTPYPVPI